VASLYKERRFSDIVVLGEEVQWHRCIRRGGSVASLY
jgi:hypothetical protein